MPAALSVRRRVERGAIVLPDYSRGLVERSERPSLAAVVLALAVPFIFLHPHWQRSVTVGPFSADFSDFAVLAAVLAAFASGLREGFAPLRGARAVWISVGLFAL